MTTPRGSCLFVLSSAPEGVSGQSFVQAYTLAITNFTVQLASPGGKPVDFIQEDDSNRRWFHEFRSKAASTPISLQSIDANRYVALLIPPAPGAVHDLATSKDLADIVNHFMKENKPVGVIGLSVAGLCGAKKQDKDIWTFQDYSLTAPSVNELARFQEFSTLPIILEDFIKDNGAKYSCSEPDAIHVIIDRHVVSGQNVESTLTVVQNLILLCNQKNIKLSNK